MSGIRVLTWSFWRLDVWDQGPDAVVLEAGRLGSGS